MRRKDTITTSTALVALTLYVLATVTIAMADDAIRPGSLVKIYAVGPSQWVRRSPTHSTNPVRAADNISQSQATIFLFEGGTPGSPIPLPSGNLNLIDPLARVPTVTRASAWPAGLTRRSCAGTPLAARGSRWCRRRRDQTRSSTMATRSISLTGSIINGAAHPRGPPTTPASIAASAMSAVPIIPYCASASTWRRLRQRLRCRPLSAGLLFLFYLFFFHMTFCARQACHLVVVVAFFFPFHAKTEKIQPYSQKKKKRFETCGCLFWFGFSRILARTGMVGRDAVDKLLCLVTGRPGPRADTGIRECASHTPLLGPIWQPRQKTRR
ncbi:hypothetical protein TW95_gp0459 [Pandoravirus inopinatum]|uniref:Uncharacterized protein n=1 Tax=Pandoravirus inopinatum TaxID=1605721 RepID=A0A0B5IWX1_9VIRU|nr:hypothetical protein TW95_gp0459 [Pandoravirus inopinatum]AJF97193.1 hypothetical protein [Pandoravirus inopinatum]